MSEERTTDEELPAPSADGLAGEFFSWHDGGELRFQRCAECGRWNHPPTTICPACGSEATTWEHVLGTGVVVSWTRTHYPFSPQIAAAGPYVAVIVAVDEGPRMVSLLRGAEPHDVRIGVRVRVDFEARSGGHRIAVFVPDKG